jgi:plasmid rolling circle replication initiator protein Rep
MLKCNICGKAGNYTQMIDYTIYSVHPLCEVRKNNMTNSKLTYNTKKELYSCPICETNTNKQLSESQLREHLMNQHTKESLIDRVLNLDKDSF